MAIQLYPIIYIYMCVCVCHWRTTILKEYPPSLCLAFAKAFSFGIKECPRNALRYRIRPSHWHMPHHALHRFRWGHGTWSCWEAVNFFNSFLHRRSECFSQCDSQTICVCVSVCTHMKYPEHIDPCYSHYIYIYISLYIPIYRWFLPMTWPFATPQSRLQVCHVRMHAP